MTLSADVTSLQEILPWRDLYRHEMNCQIMFDSLHSRTGWVEEYLLRVDGAPVGYGSKAVAGPWKDKPAIVEFYVLPQYRARLFDLFSTLVAAAGTTAIETQTNGTLLSIMLHALAPAVASESILFHDKITTTHAQPGALVRRATAEDAPSILARHLDTEAEWVVTVDSEIAGTGGMLFHYNRPYGDLFMQIAQQYQRRGLGAFLVQELKRICYQQGSIPAARCNTGNVSSRKTLQKAGFVPCGAIVTGSVQEVPVASDASS